MIKNAVPQLLVFLCLSGSVYGQSRDSAEGLAGTWRIDHEETRILEARPHGTIRAAATYLMLSVSKDGTVRLMFSDTANVSNATGREMVLFTDGRGEEHLLSTGERIQSTTKWNGKSLVRKYKLPRIGSDRVEQETTQTFTPSKDLRKLNVVYKTELTNSPRFTKTTKFVYTKI